MSTSTSEQTNFTDWIVALAKNANFQAQPLSPTLVAIQHTVGRDRHQTVWVKARGQDPLKNTIISISSPALKLGAGQWLPQTMANDLLRQNASFLHGAWAIDAVEGDDYLVVANTQIAETMDLPEFKASVEAAATVADQMEKRFGQDKF